MVLVAPERVAGVYLYRTPDSFGSRTVTETSSGVSGRLVINRSECSLLGDRLHSAFCLPVTKHDNKQECKYKHRRNQQCDLPDTVRTITLNLPSPAVDHDLKQLAVELISAGVNR